MRRLASRLASVRGFLALAVGTAALVAAGLSLSSASNVAGPQEQAYPAWESPRMFSFPGDWGKIEPVTVRTIYPAQSSWEWLASTEHPGSASMLAGTSCASCHGNPIVGASTVAGWAGPPADHRQSLGCQACHGQIEQQIGQFGERLTTDPNLESDPIAGKRPYMDVQVKASFDAEHLYLRLEWESSRPGILHDLLRWDGQKWANAGGPRPDAEKAGRKPSYEDRLTINVADADIPAYDGARTDYARAGCWITCHNSMIAMPAEPKPAAVKADPYLGDQGLKVTEVQKYLLISRSKVDAAGGWNAVKSKPEIQRLLETGQFLDMWMWRGARSGPIGYADDFYVLEYRLRDKGTAPFRTQTGDTMYDEQKMGYRAIPEARLEQELLRSPLIEGVNAARITPDARFNVGDVVPQRVLRKPDGSAADIVTNSRWENGRWTLEMRRKLNTGNVDDKALEQGGSYILGFAVFEDMVANRRHHVSFPVTLGLNTPADIVARPVEQAR